MASSSVMNLCKGVTPMMRLLFSFTLPFGSETSCHMIQTSAPLVNVHLD
jgi:hypothetical protein